MATPEQLRDIFAWIMRPRGRLIEKTLDRGWIEPNGQFWGVSEGGHSVLTMAGFKMYGYRPTQEGWICVGERPDQRSGNLIYWKIYKNDGPAEPNDQQLLTLRKIGFNAANPYVERDQKINFEDVFPEGYIQHKLPLQAGELLDNSIPSP